MTQEYTLELEELFWETKLVDDDLTNVSIFFDKKSLFSDNLIPLTDNRSYEDFTMNGTVGFEKIITVVTTGFITKSIIKESVTECLGKAQTTEPNGTVKRPKTGPKLCYLHGCHFIKCPSDCPMREIKLGIPKPLSKRRKNSSYNEKCNT